MAAAPIVTATAVADDPPTTPVAYPPRLIRYTTAIILVAVPVVAAALFFIAGRPLQTDDLLGIALFALAATIAESKPVPLDENASRTVSLSFIFILSGVALFGWAWGVLAAMACMVISQAFERVAPRRLLFNTAVYVLAAAASALPGAVPNWNGARLDAMHVGRLTVAVFAGGALFVLVNVVLVAIVAALAQGATVRSMLEDYVRHAGPAFAIMAFIAALATALWRVSPLLELLLAGPLFALALYQRYAYRTVLATTAAETDGLTGLRNHRAFQGDLRRMLEEPGVTGALVSMDIDDFKSINDRFGHPAGDEVLVQLAQLLHATFGRDATHRVGGEELAVLFEGSTAEEAAPRSTSSTGRSSTSFPHEERVSVSVGIVGFPDMASGRDALLRAADSALYWAKNHGKARTCVFHPRLVPVLTRQQIADDAERQARLHAAESLIRIVDAKDTYTGQHSQSVSRLVEAIGRRMQLDEDLIEQLRLAGLLHDLGKIATPDSILQKPGELSAEEAEVLRGHAELGYRLVEGLGVAPVDTWIRHHHEAWDGSGYPHGLAGDDIPLGSRIILVADAFDAMTSERAYRHGGSVEMAMSELRRCCWTQFDARVVAALEQHLAESDPLAATG